MSFKDDLIEHMSAPQECSGACSAPCDHTWPDQVSGILSEFQRDLSDAEEEMAWKSLNTGMGVRSTATVSAAGLSFQVEITPEVPYLTIERIVN